MPEFNINPASLSIISPFQTQSPIPKGGIGDAAKNVCSTEQTLFGEPNGSNFNGSQLLERRVVVKEARNAHLQMRDELDRLVRHEIIPAEKYFSACAESGWRLIDQKEEQAIAQIFNLKQGDAQKTRFCDADAAARIHITDVAVMLLHLRDNKADDLVCKNLEKNLYDLIAKDSLDHGSGFAASRPGNCYHEVANLEQSILDELNKLPATKDFFQNLLEHQVMPVVRSNLERKYPGITPASWEKINGCHGLISRCGAAAVDRMKESFEKDEKIKGGEFQSKVNQWRLAMHWTELERSVERSPKDKQSNSASPRSDLPAELAARGYRPSSISLNANPVNHFPPITINMPPGAVSGNTIGSVGSDTNSKQRNQRGFLPTLDVAHKHRLHGQNGVETSPRSSDRSASDYIFSRISDFGEKRKPLLQSIEDPPERRRAGRNSDVPLTRRLYSLPENSKIMTTSVVDNRGEDPGNSGDDNQVLIPSSRQIDRSNFPQENQDPIPNRSVNQRWGDMNLIHTSERQFLRNSSEISSRSWENGDSAHFSRQISAAERNQVGMASPANQRRTPYQPISTSGRPMFKTSV